MGFPAAGSTDGNPVEAGKQLKTKSTDDMYFKHNMLASFSKVTLSAILALGFLAQVKAEDKKVDPSGTWTWTMQGRQGRPDRTITMKIKVDGDKVTGKISSPGQGGQTTDTEIE